MKTQWMFAMMMLFGWTVSYSQSNLQYGLSGGIGLSNFTYSAFDDLPVFNHDPIMSYNLNAYIGIRPSEKFGLSFEPGYSRRGGKVGLLPGIIPVNASWKMEYIQLPAMLDFYLTDRISVSAGPELSWRVDSNADFLGLISDNLDRKFSAGILAGVHAALQDNFDVGVRYHRAFTPVAIVNIPGFGELIKPKLSLHNQYFQLVARYRF